MKHNQQNYNYIRNKKNEARYKLDVKEEHIKRLGENKAKREQKYGKYGNLIVIGENDRIIGNKPQNFTDESMCLSYSYGYYEKGSKVLEGAFSKGDFTEEEQRNFGILDVINDIPEKYVKKLKQYSAYVEGRIYQMGKKAYDFVEANGLSFEEYINVMSIIQPEIITLPFEQGYFARESEIKGKKIK